MSYAKWLDNSKINALERCPRQFYYRYILDLTKPSEKTTIATAFGKAIHRTLEKSVLSSSLEEARTLALESFPSLLLEELAMTSSEERDDPRAEPSTGLLLLEDFFSPSGAGSSLFNLKDEVLAVETEVEVPAFYGYTFKAMADILLRLKTGETCLVDIKTTRWRVDRYALQAVADTQLHSYAWALGRSSFGQPSSAMYLVLKVDRRRLRSGIWSNTVSTDTAIFPLALTKNHIDQMEDRIRRAALEIEGRLLARDFQCRFGSCLSWNSVCQFQPLCERFWKELPLDDQEVKEIAFSLGFEEEEWIPF